MIALGQRLRDKRVEKRLTLEDVAKATKIRASFLAAIENGDYKKLPTRAYILGFVKNYSDFLGLPTSEILAVFRREFDEQKEFAVLPRGLSREEDMQKQKIRFTKPLIFGILLFLGVLVYILFQYKYAFINPSLEVYSPKEKEVIVASEVTVSGKTDENTTVYINTVPIAINADGTFKKIINVFSGKEIIRIKAVNRFGKEAIIERQIEVKPNP